MLRPGPKAEGAIEGYMRKTRAEMLKSVWKLVAEYSEFQRRLAVAPVISRSCRRASLRLPGGANEVGAEHPAIILGDECLAIEAFGARDNESHFARSWRPLK
jgi:hypothetical protein